MDSFFIESWDAFLEDLEAWWDDCTAFVNESGQHEVVAGFHDLGADLAAFCYSNTNVDPTKLTDLTLYISTHQPRPRKRYRFPAISPERIAEQLERCDVDVAYLRASALRELEAGSIEEVRNKNDPRDEWMYEKRKRGESLELIQMDLSGRTEWRLIQDPQGIRQAIDRYCKRKNLPLLRAS